MIYVIGIMLLIVVLLGCIVYVMYDRSKLEDDFDALYDEHDKIVKRNVKLRKRVYDLEQDLDKMTLDRNNVKSRLNIYINNEKEAK